MARSDVVTFDGCIDDLNAWIAFYAGALQLDLFSNNHVPAQADTPASYTLVSFVGYAGQTLNAWDAAAYFGGVDVHKSASTFYNFQPTSTAGLPVTAYGAIIRNGSDLIAAEYFGNAFTFVDAGSILRYKPQLFAGLLPP